MKPNILLLSEEDVTAAFASAPNIAPALVEQAMLLRSSGKVLLPDKTSQIFDEQTQSRINCMSATLLSEGVSGVKWVSVFPENPLQGLRNVSGTVILSDTEHGFTRSVMDGTFITGLRTAAVGAVAAKYLARPDAKSVGFIGAGREARRHLDMLKLVFPRLERCYVSSRRETTVEGFLAEEQEKHPDMTFLPCGSDFAAAVSSADIIVTATSTQAALLKADWVKEGALYIHVGGWEDEYAVAKKASKLVCDEWECVKHRTQTLSRMYTAGELGDSDIYADLPQIVDGSLPGRENDREFIYFCSVGLAYIDVMFAKFAYDRCRELGLGTQFAL